MTRPPLLLLSAALLNSCTTATTPTTPQAQPGPRAATAQVVTVLNPDPALSDRQLAAQYDGTLVTRTSTFAVIATRTVGRLSAQGAGTASGVWREANRNALRAPVMNTVSSLGNAYWGLGTAYWGGGLSLWREGVAWWGGGAQTGTPAIANEATWQSIGLGAAHERLKVSGVPGSGVTVAVLDTSLDLTHPMFASSLTPKSTWYDFIAGDTQPQDEGVLGTGATGHGTEVAGLALIVAPGAKIMPVRVLDAQGMGHVSTVVNGIIWATDHGADIINLSLGADEPIEAVRQAVRYANSAGVVVVASAGNNGTEGLQYPAGDFAGSALNLAVGSHGAAWNKSAFSQYGALSLLAPGEDMVGPAPGNQLATWSGTSMAAPVVSGAAALALGSGSVRGAQAVSRIRATATPVDRLAVNAAFTGKLGAGRLNLDALTRP